MLKHRVSSPHSRVLGKHSKSVVRQPIELRGETAELFIATTVALLNHAWEMVKEIPNKYKYMVAHLFLNSILPDYYINSGDYEWTPSVYLINKRTGEKDISIHIEKKRIDVENISEEEAVAVLEKLLEKALKMRIPLLLTKMRKAANKCVEEIEEKAEEALRTYKWKYGIEKPLVVYSSTYFITLPSFVERRFDKILPLLKRVFGSEVLRIDLDDYGNREVVSINTAFYREIAINAYEYVKSLTKRIETTLTRDERRRIARNFAKPIKVRVGDFELLFATTGKTIGVFIYQGEKLLPIYLRIYMLQSSKWVRIELGYVRLPRGKITSPDKSAYETVRRVFGKRENIKRREIDLDEAKKYYDNYINLLAEGFEKLSSLFPADSSVFRKLASDLKGEIERGKS